ncbi:hypothetical protein QFZ54_003645 [Sphingomonas faeni]|nr:hypothetical protein [Sphingomonas faeni]
MVVERPLASGRVQRIVLERKLLVAGRYPRIADQRHGRS